MHGYSFGRYSYGWYLDKVIEGEVNHIFIKCLVYIICRGESKMSFVEKCALTVSSDYRRRKQLETR